MSQGEQGAKPPGPITIDQLLALNEEIIALVRAGVPLERGLLLAGWDIRGKLGRIAGALGGRMSRGESLVEALDGEKLAIPPLYRAVVEAGARSGQLPVALEGLARYVRAHSEARRRHRHGPLVPGDGAVAGVCALHLYDLEVCAPIRRGVRVISLTVAAPLRWLASLDVTVPYWWPIGPVFLVVLTFIWYRSGKAAQFQAGAWNVLRVFPWMRSLLNDYQTANFSELLALLLEHQVTYPSALILAAEATGDARLTRAMGQMAEAAKRGEPAGQALASIDRKTLRPMLRWVLATGQEQGSLVTALHDLADLYRKRANYQADKLQVLLPMILMIGIGGTATFFYGLALFVPIANLLSQLGSQ